MSAFSQRLHERWQRSGQGLRLTLQYFVLTRILITVFAIASERLIGHYDSMTRHVVTEGGHRFGNAFFDAWSQWDSNWYLQIAMHGYSGIPHHNGEVDIAFFPLYPFLVKVLAWPFGLGESAVLSMGLLISSAGFIAGGYFLYRLAERKFGSEVAKWALLFLFLSPMGFVLSAFLSEGLFVFLVAAALLWADEGKWRRVALVGSLLPLARPVGAVVMLIVGLIYLQQQKWSLKKLWQPKTLWVIGPIIGVAVLLLVNYMVTHNPFGFLAAEHGWGRGFLKLAGPSGGLLTFQGLYLVSYAALSMLIVTAYLRKLGWVYWLLTFCLIVLPGLTGLYGLIRYSVVILPLYLALGLLAKERPGWQIPLVIILTFIQAVHLVWWSLGMPIMQ